MSTGKTYSTKYLLDSNNNRGAAGQVLSTTSTGIDWVDANTVPGTGLWLASGNNIYNSNSGNVGIGVTTTGAKLQIDKANANSSVIISRSGTNIGVSTGVGSITFPSHYNSSYTDYAAIQAYSNALSTVRGSLDLKVKSTSGNLLTGLTVYGTSSGVNVGIGTTSPGYKLSVNGDIHIPQNEYIYFDNTAHYIRRGSSDVELQGFNGLNLRTNGSSRLYIKQDGKVGIGTTSPGVKLVVADGPKATSGTLSQNSTLDIYGVAATSRTDSATVDMLRLHRAVTNDNKGSTFAIGLSYYEDPGSNLPRTRVDFKTTEKAVDDSDATKTVMSLVDSGNVGISTTNPTSKLHIAKTTTWGEMSNPIINIQNNGTGGNINTAHNMGSITWKSGSVSTAEIKAVRNTPASGDNVELRFSTSDAGVQGERMTIQNDGVVLINNSLGVNVTSITTGYKLVVGGGDISANQAVAKISLGQIGSQGDAHFGASGIGSPTVGSQDYGFYSAHNAYRTSTGAWKHSRTDAIGAVRILGGGGGSSGNAGFSFDYSANNGTNDITWTNLMHLSTGGNIQLPSYGAGVLTSDVNGNIYAGADIDIDSAVTINDNLVNYRFTTLENTAIQYWLLCYNTGNNDVNGTLWGDRSSGHHQAMNLDIVISAKSASMQTGMITTKQVLELNEKYTLVTLTYNSVSYVAIKYEGHPYPVTGNGYFTGLLKSTIGNNFLLALNSTQVSSVAAFSNANTKATIQADKVGIGTADPSDKLDVTDGNAKMVFGSASSDRPLLYFQHNAVPVDAEEVGLLDFRGYNDASQDTRYVILTAKAEDVTDGSEDGSLTFQTMKNGTATHSMTLKSGNVGIGTEDPGAKFHVEDSSVSYEGTYNGRTTAVFENGSSAGSTISIMSQNTGYSGIFFGDTTLETRGQLQFEHSSDSFKFLNGGGSERMRINTAGNVGINTTSPVVKLQVKGNNIATRATTTAQSVLRLVRDVTDTAFPSTKDSAVDFMLSRQQTVNNNLPYTRLDIRLAGTTDSSTPTLDVMSLLHNGNVGIGTTSPGSKLTVNGDARLANSGKLYLWNDHSINYLDYRTWVASSSAGMTIQNSAAGGNILLIPNGNVGIGTTNPGSKLEVTGDTASALLTLKSENGGSNDAFMRFYDEAGGGSYSVGLDSSDSKFKIAYGTDGDSLTTGTKLVMDTSGNVGIGTTSPSQKLHVVGKGLFTDDIQLNQTTPRIDYGNTTTAGGLRFWSTNAGGEKMRITSAGNVGIGATSPTERFQVYESGLTAYKSYTTTNAGAILTAYQSTSSPFTKTTDLVAGSDGTVPSEIRFLTRTAGTSTVDERMRINAGGLVGIGTDSPLYRLDVHSAGSGIRHYGNATNQLSTYCYGAYQVMIATNGTITNEFGYAAGNFYVQTNDEEKFRITSGGDVGIGTTNPSFKLHVDSDVASGDVCFIHHDNPSQSSGTVMKIRSDAGDNAGSALLNIENNTGNALYVRGDRNVGIGTTSPGQKLDVAGNIECSSLYLNNASSLYFVPTYFGQRIKANCGGLLVQDGSTYQAVYASAFSVQSDYRLKSNVVPLDNAIDRLKQMSVHRFNWNDRLDEPKVDGFIAHELSEVVPEAVLGEKDATKEDGTPDYQGIDQSKIVPLLTAALQDAITKIEQLETRIQTLENND